MQKGWLQTWKNLLFQHFEIKDIGFLKQLLPKNAVLDSFEGKYYLGLVSMQMTNVRHMSMPKCLWFERYNELNVRIYITIDGNPGVLFLSLDVDSIISVIGARIFYGLPYRYRRFGSKDRHIVALGSMQNRFECEYTINDDFKVHPKGSFAYWATERYFFANRHNGVSLMGTISHEPWRLATANVTNKDLSIITKNYDIISQNENILFCDAIDVTTSNLRVL